MSDSAPPPESLLPYDRWTEEAMRNVALRALEFAAKNGLPGEHHFYLTFRTDHPETKVPGHLKARYPQEMTIVLQHQFWDLKVDEEAELFSVGLSFGGIPSTLVIPLGAITGFADPQVRLALRFTPEQPDALSAGEPDAEPAPEPETAAEADGPAPDPTPQVVSLDAFRKRST
jgi:uncharacterized protein